MLVEFASKMIKAWEFVCYKSFHYKFNFFGRHRTISAVCFLLAGFWPFIEEPKLPTQWAEPGVTTLPCLSCLPSAVRFSFLTLVIPVSFLCALFLIFGHLSMSFISSKNQLFTDFPNGFSVLN